LTVIYRGTNSAAATHLICVSLWGQKSAFVLQLLNLTCVLGFMTSPLLVKPFLQTEADSNNVHNDSQYNSSQVTAAYSTHSSPATATSRDVTVTSYDAVTQVFVIVAVYSLLVGLLMLAIFIKDYHAQRRDTRLSGGIMQMSSDTAAAEADDRLYPVPDNSTSHGECIVANTTTHRVVTFRVKVTLLFFAFNFFYGGIEVGYAGLVMTYAVTYLNWSKDDGTTLVFLLQASNALVTALSVCLSRYIQPQVTMATLTRSSATAKSAARPSCLVGVLCDILGRKSVDG